MYVNLHKKKEMTLVEWIKLNDFTIAQACRELSICRHSYYDWVKKGKDPTRFTKKRIERLTKGMIKINDWGNQ